MARLGNGRIELLEAYGKAAEGVLPGVVRVVRRRSHDNLFRTRRLTLGLCQGLCHPLQDVRPADR
jgi:hypothetical protein